MIIDLFQLCFGKSPVWSSQLSGLWIGATLFIL